MIGLLVTMLFSRSKHSPVSLPAGHEFPGFAAVGGLMTYGTSFTEAGRFLSGSFHQLNSQCNGGLIEMSS
jgi:hypothetical protein